MVSESVDLPLVIDDMQLEADAMAWEFVPLTQAAAQVALDAVRYQSNYLRTVTTRLCLHSISTIRKRVSSSITSYLFSVDGCELSLVNPTGRCDIYFCRPYTYELQLVQKAIESDIFVVQSIYKTLDQKSLEELRLEASNLDFSTMVESIFYPYEIPLHTEQPIVRQAVANAEPESPILNEDPVNSFSHLKKLWKSQPIPTQEDTISPLSLRVEPASIVAAHTENIEASRTATVIAIIGIATVAISTIAFVVALLVVRWRGRVNATELALSEEYPPLSGVPKSTEGTVSTSSTQSVASDTKPEIERITGFLI
ncbi:uncharacterized protein PITG_00059 [Phytophthora infestans T30-4]|uniref:Uncharacterized protein n=2 Tax=Phytophthora infestans TaxID=4787 RepID=D0MSS3_PHYIT|nr:uncharacterized protein PITG_00059 [Phytophthora infestans T30-4]EEY57507.1 conserved hypothetical protein [Phytophthora infestans T30-4]KAF4029677.1 hypothetical protein GN244_ATG18624 [Phytophthora infestans]KAF4135360.1 hypothetical protein GN958_ATG15425 [Phytophthora infestans]|eukprot:XP_002908693.1 conserved hypothetical protein [Phytophthora infestans T30-4]